jgi:hypothetical protein
MCAMHEKNQNTLLNYIENDIKIIVILQYNTSIDCGKKTRTVTLKVK